MNDLQDLYQELILDHNRSPRNHRCIDDADRKAAGYNPLCGDRVTVYLSLNDDIVEDISFEGSGCAISTAAASLMTQAIKGKRVDEADALFKKFRCMVMDDSEYDEDKGPALGKLLALEGVKQFPARVKCATLVWHTLKAALDSAEEPVTTE